MSTSVTDQRGVGFPGAATTPTAGDRITVLDEPVVVEGESTNAEDVSGYRNKTESTTLQEYDIVVPTSGRPCLAAMLEALLAQPLAGCRQIFVVDDRRYPSPPLEIPSGATLLSSGGRGPAAARNVGWRTGTAPWVAFLDDDVLPPPDWSRALASDLANAGADCGAVQGRLVVPLPGTRRATDWERNVAGLMDAKWATADMAYRRSSLEAVGGFDERFPRAFREDADLALRVMQAGYALQAGDRYMVHPVRPADRWTSVRLQRGNADDALMRALHGRKWRNAAQAPGAGRMALHAATVGAGLSATTLAARGRFRWATAASAVWAALYVEFALRRVIPGPKSREEITNMLVTSALIPPAAVAHRLRGETRVLLHRAGPRKGARALERAVQP